MYQKKKIMICLCAQRLANTDHKTHNQIASNSIDFGLKMHYFQNFQKSPRTPLGGSQRPPDPQLHFPSTNPLNLHPSTLLKIITKCERS